jgi:hypothetical protein
MRHKLIAFGITAAMCLPFAPHPASAAVTLLVSSAGDRSAHTFSTPVVVAPVGGPLTFLNGDVQGYQVLSFDTRPDGSAPWCNKYLPGKCPLLRSPYTEAGFATSIVEGMADTVSGATYTLYDKDDPTVTALLVAL